jgi:RNA polymerase sigma-70 factor, ECF subfamily
MVAGRRTYASGQNRGQITRGAENIPSHTCWNTLGLPRDYALASRELSAVNRAAASDTIWRAFETEAMPHVDRLFRHAMWLERNRSDAEDLVQETLIQAMESFRRFAPGTNCRAWLLSILHHVHLNRLRKRGRLVVDSDLEERVSSTVPFVTPVPDHLTDADMLAALGSLPVHHQQVILLCDIEEMTYKEAAAALEVPVGTVMSRLHRGRELLRQHLTRLGFGAAARGKTTESA